MRTLMALSVLLSGSAILLSGCAAGPYGSVVTHPPEPSIRPNGQPKLLPCMIGDLLCTPQQ